MKTLTPMQNEQKEALRLLLKTMRGSKQLSGPDWEWIYKRSSKLCRDTALLQIAGVWEKYLAADFPRVSDYGTWVQARYDELTKDS